MSGVDPYKVWVWVSQIQFWLISVFVVVSFFIIIMGFVKLQQLRRSQYYLFLFCIVIGDLVTLTTILADILSQTLFINLKGPILCKALVFLSNAIACFINWSWLVMFLQRFVLLIFPFCRARGGFWVFVYSAKHLLSATLLIAVTTQSWSLILLTERTHHTTDGQVATICERETELLSAAGYKWVALIEALSTYVCPFLCTLVLDLGVLIWTQQRSKQFGGAVNKAEKEKGRKTMSNPVDTIRIQSSQSLKSGAKRRQRAIRRCLVMCTIHVLLNAPYYVLQLLDEVYMLSSSNETMIYFVYADALLYLVYLVQFPIVTLYIHSLCDDYQKPASIPPALTSPAFNRSIRSKRPSSTGQSLLSPTLCHKENRFEFLTPIPSNLPSPL